MYVYIDTDFQSLANRREWQHCRNSSASSSPPLSRSKKALRGVFKNVNGRAGQHGDPSSWRDDYFRAKGVRVVVEKRPARCLKKLRIEGVGILSRGSICGHESQYGGHESEYGDSHASQHGDSSLLDSWPDDRCRAKGVFQASEHPAPVLWKFGEHWNVHQTVLRSPLAH